MLAKGSRERQKYLPTIRQNSLENMKLTHDDKLRFSSKYLSNSRRCIPILSFGNYFFGTCGGGMNKNDYLCHL
jgi:hypothetical protein